MTIPTEDVFYKTHDKEGPVIVKMTLPSIDAKSAVQRFPHEWSHTQDGHAAAAPAVPDGLPAVVGTTSRLINGIGVKEVIRAPKPGKSSAAA